MTQVEATPIIHAMNQTTLKAVVFNVMRSLERENWFEWSSTEGLQWIEENIRSRNQYTEEQVQAMALLAMHHFLKSRGA